MQVYLLLSLGSGTGYGVFSSLQTVAEYLRAQLVYGNGGEIVPITTEPIEAILASLKQRREALGCHVIPLTLDEGDCFDV